MEIMPIREILRVLNLYTSLSFRDKVTILARLAFCACPVKEVLDRYLPERGVMLDLGCGYGIFSYLMSALRPDGAFIGIDMSSHRIEVARKSIDHKKNLKFYMADVRDVRIPKCNAIMLIDVLYMFPYRLQEQLLGQCYEKLHSDGILVIKDNSKSPYWKYIYSYAEDVIKTKLGVYGRDVKQNSSCYWDSQEFLALLSKIGFHAKMIPLRSYLPYSGVLYVCQK